MRTFVAIELDAGVRGALAACLAALQAARPPLKPKWAPPENQHLTLQFLGETEQTNVERIAAALRAAVQGLAPFEIALAGLGCFPVPARPNVLWVGVTEPSGALAGLQKVVAAQLAPLGFEPDRDTFQPHLTLARVPRDASPTDRRALGEWFLRQPPPAPQTQRVEAIYLMLSDLRPGGARYTQLATVAFADHQSANNTNKRE